MPSLSSRRTNRANRGIRFSLSSAKERWLFALLAGLQIESHGLVILAKLSAVSAASNSPTNFLSVPGHQFRPAARGNCSSRSLGCTAGAEIPPRPPLSSPPIKCSVSSIPVRNVFEPMASHGAFVRPNFVASLSISLCNRKVFAMSLPARVRVPLEMPYEHSKIWWGFMTCAVRGRCADAGRHRHRRTSRRRIFRRSRLLPQTSICAVRLASGCTPPETGSREPRFRRRQYFLRNSSTSKPVAEPCITSDRRRNFALFTAFHSTSVFFEWSR